MQVQVNTDRNIEGREALATSVQAVVENALGRLRDQITRVEVHLSDENGQTRGQNDKRCMVEARLEGRQPVAVTHQAATLDEAVEGAVAKMSRLIESTLGRGANSEAPRG
ncbi:MAG: HPF/RaiA family ribosome-associated protein [Thermoanaerobaculia bacterium]